MTDLLSQLQSATEGSREISDEVLLACGWTRRVEVDPGLSCDYGEDVECWYWTDPSGQPYATQRPDPSQNLQDAVSLVPEGLFIHMSRFSEGHDPRCEANLYDENDCHSADAATLPLTLCIAIIKAHEARSEAA